MTTSNIHYLIGWAGALTLIGLLVAWSVLNHRSDARARVEIARAGFDPDFHSSKDFEETESEDEDDEHGLA